MQAIDQTPHLRSLAGARSSLMRRSLKPSRSQASRSDGSAATLMLAMPCVPLWVCRCSRGADDALEPKARDLRDLGQRAQQLRLSVVAEALGEGGQDVVLGLALDRHHEREAELPL